METNNTMDAHEQIGLIPLGEENCYEIDPSLHPWVTDAKQAYETKKLSSGRFLKMGRMIVKLTSSEDDDKPYSVHSVITFRNKEPFEAISLIFHNNGRIYGEAHKVMSFKDGLHEIGDIYCLQHADLGIMRDAAEIGCAPSLRRD